MKKLGICGLGLIGGSLALAIRKKKLDFTIYGCDINQLTIKKALEKNIIDGTLNCHKNYNTKLDYLILSVSPKNVAGQFKILHEVIDTNTLVMDVNSVKTNIIKSIQEINEKKIPFVSIHPMSGSHKKNIDFADGDLFDGKKTIIICDKKDDLKNDKWTGLAHDFWASIGTRVIYLSAKEHDEITAITSHMPHAAASAMINMMLENKLSIKKYHGIYGNGLLDFTRISMADPAMWCDIILDNKENIINAIEKYNQSLINIKNIIQNEDREKLLRVLEDSKKFREGL